jgi:hypothetical protein
MAVALVFAMKLRDSHIYLNDDLEEFIANIQPPITEENYSEILRRNSTESDDEKNEINYHENRLHLACKEQNSLKKIKQFISTGVINIIIHILHLSRHFRTILIILIVMVGHHYIKQLIINILILFDIFSIIRQISMHEQIMV